MISITVREYARLSVGEGPSDLTHAYIGAAAFDQLRALPAGTPDDGALFPIDRHGRLCLDNYVGVIETPGDTRLEILPKHVDGADDLDSARALLCRMLQIGRAHV